MTPLIMLASLALVVMDATPATSTTSADAPKPAAVAAAKTGDVADLDRVVCKKEAITGSRFEKRICMTKAEWGEQERKTEEFERGLNHKADIPQSNPMPGT